MTYDDVNDVKQVVKPETELQSNPASGVSVSDGEKRAEKEVSRIRDKHDKQANENDEETDINEFFDLLTNVDSSDDDLLSQSMEFAIPETGQAESDLAEGVFDQLVAQAIAANNALLPSGGWENVVLVLGGIGVVGGVAAATATAGGSGGSSSSSSSTSTLSGSVLLGPVTEGLSVVASDAAGNELGRSDIESGTGLYSVDIGAYTGQVLLSVLDNNGDDGNYIDEATLTDKDLDVSLRAVVIAGEADTVAHITPLTEVAVRKLGLTSNQTLENVNLPNNLVSLTNQAIAKLFLGDGTVGIDQVAPVAVINVDGDYNSAANNYGVVLAALSGVDSISSTEDTIQGIVDGLNDLSKGGDSGWAVQAGEGQIRTDIQNGLGKVNEQDVLNLDVQTLSTTGLLTDSVAPVIYTNSLNALENIAAIGTLEGDDTSGIFWRLSDSGIDNDLFEITPNGELSFLDVKNFEADQVTYRVTVTATDADDNVEEKEITITLNDVNDVPIVSTNGDVERSLASGVEHTLSISENFSDEDGDVLTYSAIGLPEGYSINTNTGELSGSSSASGRYDVTIFGEDPDGLSASYNLTLFLVDAPQVVALTSSDEYVKDGETISVSLRFNEEVAVTGEYANAKLFLDVGGTQIVADSSLVSTDGIREWTFVGVAGAEEGEVTVTGIEWDGVSIEGATSLTSLDAIDIELVALSSAVVVDNTAPTLLISTDSGTVVSGEQVKVTFSFSEEVASFSTELITVAGGSVDNLSISESDPTVYTAVFVPEDQYEGTINLTVEAGSITDKAGNEIEATSSGEIQVDTTHPEIDSVTINRTENLITLEFSEEPIDLSVEDFNVSGGTVSNLTQTSTNPFTYTADLTPVSEEADVSLTVDGFSDLLGNQGLSGDSISLSINPPRPNDLVGSDLIENLVISGVSDPAASVSFIVFNKQNPSSSSITYTATADVNGDWSKTVNLSSIEDQGEFVVQATSSLGGSSTIGVIQEFTIDSVSPTVSITAEEDALKRGETTKVVFTFSEEVIDFTLDGVAVSNGALENLTQDTNDPKIYTAIFTPSDDFTGSVSFTLLSSSVQDAAGNQNSEIIEADVIAVDTDAPSVTITSDVSSLSASDTATLTLTFTEAPINFTADDIIVSTGTLGSLVEDTINSTVYTIEYTPSSDTEDTLDVSIEADVFVDSAGNSNLAASETSLITIDTRAPVFSSGTSEVVTENVGTENIVYDAEANDASTIAYSLTGTDAEDFSIDSSSGEVKFLIDPDFETASDIDGDNVYEVTVRATDADGQYSDQHVTISVVDENEAPVTAGAIADQISIVNQFYSLDTNSYFTDKDAGDQLTYSATGLPDGLTISSSTGLISGTITTVSVGNNIVVTVTDAGGLNTTQSFTLDVQNMPTASSLINDVTNFDVRSDIVLEMSEDVTFSTNNGTYFIELTNTSNTSDKNGFAYNLGDDDRNNSQQIAIQLEDGVATDINGGSVTIVGNKIVINPTYDLDLSNNYQITVTEGLFDGSSTGNSSLAVEEGDITFSTVTPGDVGAGAIVDLANANRSTKFGDSYNLVDSYLWLDAEALGNASLNYDGAVDLNISDDAFAIAVGDDGTKGADDGTLSDGISTFDFSVSLDGFTIDDLVYYDNPDNSRQDNPLYSSFTFGTSASNDYTRTSSGAGTSAAFGGFLDIKGLLFSSNGAEVSFSFSPDLWDAMGFSDNTFDGHGSPIVSG